MAAVVAVAIAPHISSLWARCYAQRFTAALTLSGRNLFRARLSGEQYHLQEHDGDAPDWHAFGCVGRSLISSSLIPKAQRQGGHHFVWLGIVDPKWSDDLPVVPSKLQGERPVGQIMD